MPTPAGWLAGWLDEWKNGKEWTREEEKWKWRYVNKLQVLLHLLLYLSLLFLQHFLQSRLSLFFFPSPKTHRKALETFKCCFPAMCDSSKTAALTVLQWDKPYHSLPVFIIRSLSVPITEASSPLSCKSQTECMFALLLIPFLFFYELSNKSKTMRDLHTVFHSYQDNLTQLYIL